MVGSGEVTSFESSSYRTLIPTDTNAPAMVLHSPIQANKNSFVYAEHFYITRMMTLDILSIVAKEKPPELKTVMARTVFPLRMGSIGASAPCMTGRRITLFPRHLPRREVEAQPSR